MRALTGVLIVAIAGIFIALIATDNLPFLDDDGADATPAAKVPKPEVNRFSGSKAYAGVEAPAGAGAPPGGVAANRASSPSGCGAACRAAASRTFPAIPGCAT